MKARKRSFNVFNDFENHFNDFENAIYFKVILFSPKLDSKNYRAAFTQWNIYSYLY